LEVEGRIRFDTWHLQTRGYFEVFAPHFDQFARRDSDTEIDSMHVFFSLSGNDLNTALDILSRIENEVSAGGDSWRPYLGTIQRAGQPVARMEPVLFKKRAVTLVRRLRALALRASNQGKAVCYGNGACYHAYCGAKLPAGTEYYS